MEERRDGGGDERDGGGDEREGGGDGRDEIEDQAHRGEADFRR